MRKITVMASVLLLCSVSPAGDRKDDVDKLLGRLRREPFHAELICEQIAALGEDALPALDIASKNDDLATRQAALRSAAAIAWKITPRCFYTVGSGLEDVSRFSRVPLADRLRTKLKEMEGSGNLDGLLDLVRSGDPAAALGAIEAIERLGREADAAVAVLGSVQAHDWFYAGALLARSPKKVLPVILEMLRSRSESARLASASALVIGPSPDAVTALVKALKDKSSLVRLKAAEAFGAAGEKHALEALVACLKEDTDYTVRAQAAWALGMLKGADGAAAPLIHALKDRKSSVRSRAIESLAVVGSKAALDALGAFALDGGEDSLSRNRAIRAISQIGGQGALDQLKPLFASQDEAYSTVPAVLGLLGKTALPFLRETLESAGGTNFKIIGKCQLALRVMGADAAALLLDLLGSEKSMLRLVGRTLLQALTGRDFEYDRAKWEEYLEENPPK